MGISKKNIIIANLKMGLSSKKEAESWAEMFLREKKFFPKNTFLVICPPAIFLDFFIQKIGKNDWLKFGAQDCFWENKGSFTGETSPEMIKSLDGNFVILGHSERRRNWDESNEKISKKIPASLKTNLHPILCVGETAEEKKHDQTMEVLTSQLDECLLNVSRGKIEDVIICYEPVWAISSNHPTRKPSVNEIMGAKLLIKKFLCEKYGVKAMDKVKIIYGGSVDEKNAEIVCLSPDVDGALVGKASLAPRNLLKICEIIDKR